MRIILDRASLLAELEADNDQPDLLPWIHASANVGDWSQFMPRLRAPAAFWGGLQNPGAGLFATLQVVPRAAGGCVVEHLSMVTTAGAEATGRLAWLPAPAAGLAGVLESPITATPVLLQFQAGPLASVGLGAFMRSAGIEQLRDIYVPPGTALVLQSNTAALAVLLGVVARDVPAGHGT